MTFDLPGDRRTSRLNADDGEICMGAVGCISMRPALRVGPLQILPVTRANALSGQGGVKLAQRSCANRGHSA